MPNNTPKRLKRLLRIERAHPGCLQKTHLSVTMNRTVDQSARKHLATLARRLASGCITNEQFENEPVRSKEAALHDIYFYGLWPLYDDCTEHKLVGRWALTKAGRVWVARIVLFLHSDQPYRYPQMTGIAQLPIVLLSLVTFGWFGRFWRRRQWRDGDESVWPFFSRSEYEAALQIPVFLYGNAQRGVPADRSKAALFPAC